MSSKYVRSFTIEDPEQLADAVPGALFRAHALFNSPFRVELQNFDLGDIALQVGNSSPFAGIAAAGPGRAILQVPFGKIETLRLNGVALEQSGVGIYGPGAELQRSNPQDNRHFTLTIPAALVDPILEPPSNARLFRPGQARLLLASSECLSDAIRLVRQANATAYVDPQRFQPEQARLSFRATLLGAVRELLAAASTTPVRYSRSTAACMRITRAADEFIRSHPTKPLYPEQVAEALGVSGRALQDAFQAHLATTPYRLLERRRLGMVRSELIEATAQPISIRAVALSHGFWNFRQFCIDYEANFGEPLAKALSKEPGAR